MTPADRATPPPSRVVLPDGRVLSSPTPSTADSLTVGDWVLVRGGPAQITDLRFRHGGGRVVHLRHQSPLTLGARDVLVVYRYTSVKSH